MPKAYHQPGHEQDNSHLFWQQHIGLSTHLKSFQSLVQRESIPPVLLLIGREGIGKRSLAAAITAMFTCKSQNACGECSSCKEVVQFRHQEILFIDQKSQPIKVEQAHLFQEHLAIKAQRSQDLPLTRRVACIFDIEHMTVQASNRLLKTIEEPPPYTQIILTTNKAKLVLPTILSRCVKWKISPPNKLQSVELLKTRFKGDSAWGHLTDRDFTKLLDRNGLAVGKVIKELEQDFEQRQAICDDLERIMSEASPLEVLETAEKYGRQKTYSAADICDLAELTLNRIYRRMVENQNQQIAPIVLKQRRAFLSELKLYAGKKKIALNTQLAIERLGNQFK